MRPSEPWPGRARYARLADRLGAALQRGRRLIWAWRGGVRGATRATANLSRLKLLELKGFSEYNTRLSRTRHSRSGIAPEAVRGNLEWH